jgi:hypothetical protein
MNFFEILFWMGMLCLVPVLFVVGRDMFRVAPSWRRLLPDAPPPQNVANPMA